MRGAENAARLLVECDRIRAALPDQATESRWRSALAMQTARADRLRALRDALPPREELARSVARAMSRLDATERDTLTRSLTPREAFIARALGAAIDADVTQSRQANVARECHVRAGRSGHHVARALEHIAPRELRLAIRGVRDPLGVVGSMVRGAVRDAILGQDGPSR